LIISILDSENLPPGDHFFAIETAGFLLVYFRLLGRGRLVTRSFYCCFFTPVPSAWRSFVA
jgi:hypothetical protein